MAGFGRVYLVGAGPGAADLLTLRAARLLAQADVVLHDALVTAEVLAMAPQARKIAVGKRCGGASATQSFINRQMIAVARQHRLVVRLKGGDPMLFGRAEEEIRALTEAGIVVEVVPGISAGFGASASLGQSLTQRGVSRSVVFVTPRVGVGESDHNWAKAVVAADTAVLYMAGQNAPAIAAGVINAGARLSLPVVLVAGATLTNEQRRHATLAELAQGGVDFETYGQPVLMLIGDIFAEGNTRTNHQEQQILSEPAGYMSPIVAAQLSAEPPDEVRRAA